MKDAQERIEEALGRFIIESDIPIITATIRALDGDRYDRALSGFGTELKKRIDKRRQKAIKSEKKISFDMDKRRKQQIADNGI